LGLTDKDNDLAPPKVMSYVLVFIFFESKNKKYWVITDNNKTKYFMLQRITDKDNDLSLSAFCCSLFQRTKNILLLFLSKQNKTTKCKNKKHVFVFFFVNRPWRHVIITCLGLTKKLKKSPSPIGEGDF